MYYSTGKSRHLGHAGKLIGDIDSLTAEILIKKGEIVESLSELKLSNAVKEKSVDLEENTNTNDNAVVEQVPKRRGNPNFSKKQ